MSGVAIPRPELLFQAELDDYPAAMTWSAKGRWLAVGASSGKVALYEPKARGLVRRWQAHQHGLHDLAWQPGGGYLASSGQDGYARLWALGSAADDVDIEQPTAELALSAAWVEHLAWRPDGRQLAAAAAKQIGLFAVDDKVEQIDLLEFTDSSVAALAWRPQPRAAQLAAAGYGAIRLWDTSSGSNTCRALRWQGSMLSLVWSPDGKVIACGCQDNTVHCWWTASSRDIYMAGYDSKPLALAWSRNGRWLASGGSNAVTLWPFDGKGPHGRKPTHLEFHEQLITALSFAPRGDWLASTCREGILCLWQPKSPDQPKLGLQMRGKIECLSWAERSPSPLLLLAAVNDQGRIGVWEVPVRTA